MLWDLHSNMFDLNYSCDVNNDYIHLLESAFIKYYNTIDVTQILYFCIAKNIGVSMDLLIVQ